MKKEKFSVNIIELGDRLHDLRRKHNLKQDTLAVAAGITRAAYSGIETGRFGASIAVLKSIMDLYKEKGELLSIDYLVGISPQPKQMSAISSEAAEKIKALEKNVQELKRELDFKNREIELLSKQLDICNSNLTRAIGNN